MAIVQGLTRLVKMGRKALKKSKIHGPPTEKRVIQEKINKLKIKRSHAKAIKGRAAPSEAVHKSNAREANAKILIINKKIDILEKQKKALDKPKPKTKPKVKRKSPDRSKVMDHSGKMGSAVRGARYKGKKEEFEKLVDKVEDLRAQGKIEEANKIMNSRKFKDLGDWDADYAGRKSGGPIVKKPMGGKVYKNIVSRKHGGAIGTGAALRGFGKGYKKG